MIFSLRLQEKPLRREGPPVFKPLHGGGRVTGRMAGWNLLFGSRCGFGSVRSGQAKGQVFFQIRSSELLRILGVNVVRIQFCNQDLT